MSDGGSLLDDYLEEARSHLTRLTPEGFEAAVAAGALVVDTRPTDVRERQGEVPGAMVIGLNVLEWRLAPSSSHRVLDVDPARTVVVVCAEGYSSSLAARRLQQLGLPAATDLVGGVDALFAHRRSAP